MTEKPNRLIDFYRELAAASNCYSPPGGRFLRITHPFATVDSKLTIMKADLPSDVHVLSIPPAFILSQAQTLQNGQNYFPVDVLKFKFIPFKNILCLAIDEKRSTNWCLGTVSRFEPTY